MTEIVIRRRLKQLENKLQVVLYKIIETERCIDFIGKMLDELDKSLQMVERLTRKFSKLFLKYSTKKHF